MFNKKIFVIGFLIIACIQLYVPAKMIYDQENVLRSGNEFKFKSAPIDPNDPFRGKYITLRFDATTFTVQNKNEWAINEEVFVQIENDSSGFVQIKSVSKKRPGGYPDYIKAKISFITDDGNVQLRIDYPFDRFYMEESKAQEAENIYLESNIDSSQIAYALVNVKEGEAVIKNVMINDIPIAELVKANRNR